MSKPALDKLREPSKKFRAPIARGLAVDAGAPRIERDGGNYGAGIIRGCAVCTRGEALGDGTWIDRVMLASIATAIQLNSAGLKARFTHPGLSGDGLGKFIGRFFNASLAGDIVRADLHLAQSATDTPDGNLAAYVLNLAAEDPEAFGTSIVFLHDPDQEDAFVEGNGGYEKWISPDPQNVDNYFHCRLGELLACDAVDEPAANPGGLFHRGQDIPREAEALLNFALGISTEKPAGTCFDIDPDRAAAFLTRYLARHHISLWKDSTMAKPAKQLTAKDDKKPDEKPVDEKPVDETEEEETDAAAKPVDEKPAEPAADPAEPDADDEDKKKETEATAPVADGAGKKFLAAFGDRGGVLFAEGKTFDEAQQIVLKETQAENKALKAEVAKTKDALHALRGDEPVSSGAEPTAEELRVAKLSQNLGNPLAKFAGNLRFAHHHNN